MDEEKEINGVEMDLETENKGEKQSFVYREYFALSSDKPGDVVITCESKRKKTFPIHLPFAKESIKLAILGDNQIGASLFQRMLKQMKKEKADVFLHLGDMVQLPWRDQDWQGQFFNPLQSSDFLPSIPFIIAQGNHDFVGGHSAEYFPDTFELEGYPTGNYYALTLAGTRIIVMDTNFPNDHQIKWLEKELASEASRKANFRIVSVHIPPFIEYWDPIPWKKGENQWPLYIRDRAVPLFEKYKVDLVLSGHQHNYQRGERNKVMYVISGGGGGDLDRTRVEDFGFYSVTFIEHHYLIMEILKDQLIITMKSIDNYIKDRIQITKKN